MGLTFSQYEYSIKDSVAQYIRKSKSNGKYIEFTLGIFEEAAEVTSPIRRSIEGNFHEQELDIDHLKEEIGDVVWYISQIASQLPNSNLTMIALNNLRKTHSRYGKNLNLNESMNISQYIQGVLETYKRNLPESKQDRARFFCLGLIKEMGALSSYFGESIIDGTELKIDKVKEKLGDSLWYLTAISDMYGINLEDACLNNCNKVHGRYNKDGTVRKDSPELEL